METFLGYRLFRVTLFLFGFSVTTVAVLLPIWDALSSSEPNAFYIALGVALVAGLAVGVLGAWMPKIGVFLVGAGLGAVVGVILGFTVLYKLYPANPNVPLGVAASVLGLALGILAVFIMRVTVVVSTSVVGAYMTVRGVMVYASPDLNESAIYSTVQSGGSVPAAWYGYAAGIVILALLGIVVQFMFTARKPKGKEAEKDVWEESYEEAELSLEALRTGGGKSKKGRRSSKKEARRSAKKARKAEKKRLKADALLHDYEPGGEFYEEVSQRQHISDCGMSWHTDIVVIVFVIAGL
jgi:MFS family permease